MLPSKRVKKYIDLIENMKKYISQIGFGKSL